MYTSGLNGNVMTDITDLEKLMNKVSCVGTKIHDLCHSNVQHQGQGWPGNTSGNYCPGKYSKF